MKRVGKCASAAVVLITLSCSTGKTGPEVNAGGDLSALATATIVDLTYRYDEDTLYWPTSPSAFELEQLAFGDTEGGFFYSANAFSTPEHGGTHLDAPIHFSAGGWTTDQIPLDRLIAPAVVLDVADQSAAEPDYALTVEDVEAWETANGTIADGSIVLLRTGWGHRWPDRKSYLGDDTPGDAANLHFPSFGREAAQLLVQDRRVAALGVDTASIDTGTSTDFWVHRIAGEANVPGLENVANLDLLPLTGAWVIALPMKIGGGTGAPVRMVAAIPSTE